MARGRCQEPEQRRNVTPTADPHRSCVGTSPRHVLVTYPRTIRVSRLQLTPQRTAREGLVVHVDAELAGCWAMKRLSRRGTSAQPGLIGVPGAAAAQSSAGERSGWIPCHQPDVSYEAGEICAFEVFGKVVRAHESYRNVSHWSEGTVRIQLFRGSVVIRWKNVDTGRTVLRDQSGARRPRLPPQRRPAPAERAHRALQRGAGGRQRTGPGAVLHRRPLVGTRHRRRRHAEAGSSPVCWGRTGATPATRPGRTRGACFGSVTVGHASAVPAAARITSGE